MSPEESDDRGHQDQADAWHAFGLIVSGLTVWGGAGWLLSELLDNTIYLVLGILLGVGLAMYLVWVRYGRA